MKQVESTPTSYAKRDRVVTPDGLGHITHNYGDGSYAIKYSQGNWSIRDAIYLRPAVSKDFKKGKAEIYKNDKGKWNFRLKKHNNKQVGGSEGQGYSNRVDMIDVLNNNYIDFEIVRV